MPNHDDVIFDYHEHVDHHHYTSHEHDHHPHHFHDRNGSVQYLDTTPHDAVHGPGGMPDRHNHPADRPSAFIGAAGFDIHYPARDDVDGRTTPTR